ncbi:MAG TPA: carbohydrate ABC transporter permease [Phototrophicaceae bacterium]|nr:carbohydrate ABC transporter permease [Phototrophicaceae bacterium]
MLAQQQKPAATALKYGILIALCLVIMGPVATAILGSIRTNGEFMTRPFGLPTQGIQWENYTSILLARPFWNSMLNSVLLTGSITVLNVLLSSMLAFVFSRIEFRGRSLLFNILMIGMLFPLVVAILPIFIQVRQLGLVNSMFGVILPFVAFGLPGSVVILRNFFITVPVELEDAAYIDGCTTFGFFRHILMPMSRPSLLAVATLQVIAGWNEYFLPLLVFTDPQLWPLPLGLMQFQGQYGTDYARIMAYVTLLMIPAVLFYLFAEKYIVTGLTGGELKG